jgi:exopolysaccharide production protein ExoY
MRESYAWVILSTLERLMALLLLLVLGPFLLLVALTIVLLSGMSPLIAHRRLGYGGVPFWVLKFRTMWPRAARRRQGPAVVEYIVDESGPRRKAARDHRISSAFARFCRRHSIDELPQLVHVVMDEMSLVGPRPITAAEARQHYRSHAAEVLGVKPGLSGLWQTRGRSRLSYEQRRNLDLALVRNRSVKQYFQILLWTVPEVFSGRNAW